MGRKGAIALALMAARPPAGCGGKKKAGEAELKGTVTFGVLAPTGARASSARARRT